jgi:hypothetical protein
MEAITYQEIQGTNNRLISKKQLQEKIMVDYPDLSNMIIASIFAKTNVIDENIFLEKLEEFCRYCQIPLPYEQITDYNTLETYLYKDDLNKKYISLNDIVDEYQEYREMGEPCGNKLYLKYNNNILVINHTEYDGCGPFEVKDYELLCTMEEFAELSVNYLTYKQHFDDKGIFVSFKM